MIRSACLVLIAAALLAGCSDAFEYSPNQIHDNNSPKDLNEKNLRRLQAAGPGDTLTVVFAGDSQQFYDEVDLFVRKVNSLSDVDFVLIGGDISNYGLLQEFELIVARLDRLKSPYFGVIGNHDVVANGEEIFRRMFGPLDDSFVYDSVKFILHNTNSREFHSPNVPDLAWLAGELTPAPGIEGFVAVSHVPPFDADFDPALIGGYTSLFRDTPGFLLSLHGHTHSHSDGYPYGDGIRYITSDSFERRSFIPLKFASGTFRKELVTY